MLRLNSTGARSAASLSALLVALIIGFFILKPFFADMTLSEAPLRPELLKATAYDGKNPSHHYRLALHYYYDPLARDVPAAFDSYRRAISLNPANAVYWLGLVNVYESLGDIEAARSALARALYLNPTYVKSRWMVINLLLKEGGAKDKLVRELGRIIKDFPNERRRAFSVLHRITNDDVERILADAIAGDFKSMRYYLLFLMSRKDTPGVTAVYKTLSNGFEVSDALALKYTNYLVSVGEIWEARRYLDRYKGREAPGGEGLLLNGGFEDEICHNAFCWKLRKVEGARIGIDEKVFFAGRRSLKIEFDGTANVSFHHVSILVPLESNRSYTLSAFIKTEGLTTTNGFYLEFYGAKRCGFIARTDVLSGTNAWQEWSLDITTAKGCDGGTLRLRRLKSQKLDNRIGGRVWLDGVRLLESRLPAGHAPLRAEGVR